MWQCKIVNMHAILSSDIQEPNYKNFFPITSSNESSEEIVNKEMSINKTTHIE